MKGRPLAAWYLGAQAALVCLWWGMLVIAPTTRAWFAPPDRPEVLVAFWLPDALIICGSSIVASLAAARRSRGAAAAAWVALGGLAYATLYCVGLVIHAGGPWLPVITMAPACVVTALCAARL